MHGQSAALLGQVTGHQHGTMAADQAARARSPPSWRPSTGNAEDVQARLDQLDKDAGDAFDAALSEARQVFESYVQAELDKRYSDVTVWIKDKLLGMPDEVNDLEAGRELYLKRMDGVISRVADIGGGDLARRSGGSRPARPRSPRTSRACPRTCKVGADARRRSARSSISWKTTSTPSRKRGRRPGR